MRWLIVVLAAVSMLAGDSSAQSEQRFREIAELVGANRYQEAAAAARALLADLELLDGAKSPSVARALYTVVECLTRLRKQSEPETLALAERALAIREQLLGPKHSLALSSRWQVGKILSESGDWIAARPLLERTLEDSERILGPEQTEFQERLSDLAAELVKAGDYTRARPLAERALEAARKAARPLDEAQALTVLGFLCFYTRDYKGAVPLLHRAWALREKELGANRHYTWASMNNLARGVSA